MTQHQIFCPDSLIEARKSSGLTQAKLALMINDNTTSLDKISAITVYAWETGRRECPDDIINILSEIFNVPLTFFYKNVEEFSNRSFILRNILNNGMIDDSIQELDQYYHSKLKDLNQELMLAEEQLKQLDCNLDTSTLYSQYIEALDKYYTLHSQAAYQAGLKDGIGLLKGLSLSK